uniref:Uncharacterized protein n=1 Tax=Anopheles atroparvus TaxID=41427 RepID=A0AAG5CPP3_ANOAO
MSVATMGANQPEQGSSPTVSSAADDQFLYVSREQYDQLLKDYNKLKEKYENSGEASPKDNGQKCLEACMSRLERFEYRMSELQKDFRDIKATIRSQPVPSRTQSRETAARRAPGDDETVNFIMTIVHPKRAGGKD